MDDVKEFFREIDEAFTIYVVEQRFVTGRGYEFFRSYKGKENYIDTDSLMKKRLFRILQGINKKIPDSAVLIKNCFNATTPIGLVDVITSLFKLFTVQEHQAVGPDVLDPIIIQEGNILPKYVTQIISLHKFSILRPTIIILLKDNNFIRAQVLLAECPHNTNIKMIRNSGETELLKVINCGAQDPDGFLDSYARHCFSTCSQTNRNVLFNKEWAGNSIVKLYAPLIMQTRTNFLYQDKTMSRTSIDDLIFKLDVAYTSSDIENSILQSFRCILRLYRVFCNDGGAQDIKTALEIATSLNNEILIANVYRCAYFLNEYSFNDKLRLLDIAYEIFTNNHMEDNAIYCKNNRLVRGFDTDDININDFLKLREEAVNNVPGLVGMSHIFNNVGVAHLMNGYPDESIIFFDKGLDYAYRPERCIQKLALLCNRAIARSYCFESLAENELYKIMNMIFDNNELLNVPFISSRYAINTIAIALKQKKTFGEELIHSYPIDRLVQQAFQDNMLGAGQLILQTELLQQKYNCFDSLAQIIKPLNIIPVTGIKRDFLKRSGYNPFIFSTWF